MFVQGQGLGRTISVVIYNAAWVGWRRPTTTCSGRALAPIGTQGTISEDPAHDRPEVWGWSLPDCVLVGAAVLKWPATREGQCLEM